MKVNTSFTWSTWTLALLSLDQAKALFSRKMVLTVLLMFLAFLTGCSRPTPELKQSSALIAIDYSGSMGAQLEQMEQCIVQLLKLLTRANVTYVKVVAFANESNPDALTVLYEGRTEDVSNIRECIEKHHISQQRGTNFAPVLQLAAEQKFDLLFYETDGGSNDLDATAKAIATLGEDQRVAFIGVTEYRGKLEKMFNRLVIHGDVLVCGPQDWLDRCEKFVNKKKG